MKRIKNDIVLAIIAAVLAITCGISIYAPVRFEKQQTARENAVKERLVKIRYAEEKYKRDNGVYTDDFANLIKGGYLADSLQYIPFTGNKTFSIVTTVQTGKSGRQIPLMECGAGYDEYLSGLDENRIANLIEEANNAGRYPGLKIGDITIPNDNAGNWE